MAELGSGCYLTFSTASQGSLFTNYSEAPIEGALAYFKPGKPVPKFKFTQNGGKSELIRTIQGPNIKRYYQGWTQFVKMAMDSKGEFVLLQGPSFKEGPVAIVFNFKGQVQRTEENKPYSLEGLSAVAAIHPANEGFNVITMQPSLFREVGEGAGAAMQF